MLNASRKRVRSNSITDRPEKVPRLSWKASHHLPESSPVHARQSQIYSNHPPALDTSSTFLGASDEETVPELPALRSHNVSSSLVSSSPPRTPTLRSARLPRTDKDLKNEDGADLLLFLANSPTPARVSRTQIRDFPPSTPPSQYAALPSMTPTPGGGLFGNQGTPNQQFNFADFVSAPRGAQWSRVQAGRGRSFGRSLSILLRVIASACCTVCARSRAHFTMSPFKSRGCAPTFLFRPA